MSDTVIITTTAPPPVQGYEVAITRKIKSRNVPIFRTFQNFDEDNDGKISKDDFKNAVYSQCGLSLSDLQIDHIFSRSAYLAPPQVKDKVQGKMSFQEFAKYLDVTAYSMVATSHAMDTDYSPRSTVVPMQVPGVDRTSQEGKAKRLREMVSRKIQQSLPVGRETTFAVLNIDTRRDTHITGKEFEHWLRKQGFPFTDDDMKLVRGDWKKEKGLTLQEFNFFINCLKNNCTKNDSNSEMFEKLSNNEGYEKVDEDGNSKTDEELIHSLLVHFRQDNNTLLKIFDILNITNAKSLSAHDIQEGLKKAKVIVSIERAKVLIDGFTEIGGRMSRPNFVRFMTSVTK